MSDRDPRIDPQQGDVLYKDGVTKTVDSVAWFHVVDGEQLVRSEDRRMSVRSTWSQKSPFGRKMNTGRRSRPTVAAWRRWAKGATVKVQAP